MTAQADHSNAIHSIPWWMWWCRNLCCKLSAAEQAPTSFLQDSIPVPHILMSEGDQATEYIHLHLASWPWRIKEVEVEQGRNLAQLRMQQGAGSANRAITKSSRTKYLDLYEPVVHQEMFYFPSQLISSSCCYSVFILWIAEKKIKKVI